MDPSSPSLVTVCLKSTSLGASLASDGLGVPAVTLPTVIVRSVMRLPFQFAGASVPRSLGILNRPATTPSVAALREV